ncbi:MAG TPA: thiopeptide-type bacteriocin biosynthesis protein [Thermoanaerobaculia bacterium]|nr:thiopeptide-type bacteriocin biosynthesis protein [Thermoanaerobaculia bacterium]
MSPPGWLSFHLYYYETLLRPILRFVRPAVVELLQSEAIDRFFFIRYGLGGPHIRLRLQPAPGRHGEVEAQVRKQAAELLEQSPSNSNLTREALEKSTQAMLASDPHETDGNVYPDNSLLEVPFRPETNRYGGPELLEASLDFFTVSSLEALAFLNRHSGAPKSRQLPWMFRLLFRQAVGFAAGLDELNSILRYAEISWGKEFPNIVEKADATFQAQRDTFISLLEEEIRICFAEPSPRPVLLEAARLLGHATKAVNSDRRWVIGGSQLHMTANRMAASNPEEVYLSRLLFRAWEDLQAAKPPDSAWIGSEPAAGPETFEVSRWTKQRIAELI